MKSKNYIIENTDLMKEWDYEKNKNLDPKTITNGSNKKAWWKCNKEHKYISKIAHRVNGSGCPYCSNTKVLKGYNDLKTKYPKIAKEWNYEKNKGLTPEMVMSNSHKKVWWKCNKGHEWEVTIILEFKIILVAHIVPIRKY